MNRALLKKLRPGSLGRVGIAELVEELIASFHGLHPDTRIAASVGRLAQSYGEAIDLTLYRCIQEGVTNALRHGRGGNISVELGEQRVNGKGSKRSQQSLCLTVHDDGEGFDASAPKGFGLSSMTERVRALGGTLAIKSTPAGGTTITVVLPVQRKSTKRARQLEPVGVLI
jgi:two-component system sensor histidine kinase UhpB